jgi:Rod binding domain-containing protein
MTVLHSLPAQAAATAPSSALSVPASSAPSPKLVKAAHEFEAQMMKELLAPMTGSDPLFGDEDDDGGDSGPALGSGSGSGGALADFASEALGQALSERGGFGIANKIIRQLAPASIRQKNKNLTTEVTGLSHRNTVMKTNK